jgi:ribonuclease P protein component
LLEVKARFPRSVRLLTPADFSRVFKQPTRSSDDCFTVFARVNSQNKPRLGLAIAKKNVRRAVDRNLIKRIVRENFRQNQQTLTGIDVVVMARRGIPLSDTKRLGDSLFKHWQRIARRCNES